MRNTIKNIKRIEPIWLILVSCVILFSFLSREFLSLRNIINILLQISVTGIIALGMTFLMISGAFDLSVGSVMALSAVVTVISVPSMGVGAAIVMGIFSGLAVGILNGFFVVKGEINAFITTLGSMFGIRGIVYMLTREHPVICLNENFQILGNEEFLYIPIPFLIFLGLAVVTDFVLRKTIHGRNSYAIGGNKEAARNVGIPINKHLMINFIICSFTAAIGGVINASRMGSATPILGRDTAIKVISAVILGGTRLKGGYGSALGTVGGVLVLGIIQNGLNQLNVQVYYQILIDGLILIFVIYIDSKVDKFCKE
ncbi:ribose ABC transporter [Candidatus Atribacteria bacterium HGW-Atribacteria-1]|nr:MAG: ribose ABC transporter [Candidatus Atribacteria bacterium HGW-Atribacteria-1]